MSIEIRNLSKTYGAQKALNDVSFSVGSGEIVGFLGPNGAGKSTTMKIATCYLPPGGGQVKVGGWDVTIDPMEVKRITGYLPEHNPLYTDLYVHEYLHFIGKLYGLRGKKLAERVSEMVEMCGLTREQNKKIEALSKGYRQRVGLAQALIHDPAILILDEPTSGLDPNQLLEIRKLIREISVNKTVIFSTHIMQEVEALCDRVILISRGAIVADDRLEFLVQNVSSVQITQAQFDGPIDIALLTSLPGVIEVKKVDSTNFRISSDKSNDIRPYIFRMAADNKLSLVGLRQEENSLETVFHQSTNQSTSIESNSTT